MGVDPEAEPCLKSPTEDEKETLCGICLSEKVGIRGEIESCSHLFCFVCIMAWAQVESRCPLCKRRFASIRRHAKPGIFPAARLVNVPVRDKNAIGGLSRAIAMAKQKAGLPQDTEVTLVELSRPSSSLFEIVSGFGSSVLGVERTLNELLESLASSQGIQARMDGIMFHKLEGDSYFNPFFILIKDILSSL